MRTLRFLMKHGEPPAAEPPGERDVENIVRVGGREMVRVTGSVVFEYSQRRLEVLKKLMRGPAIRVGSNGSARSVGIADNVIVYPPRPDTQPEGTLLHAFPSVWSPLEHEEEVRGKLDKILRIFALNSPNAQSNGIIPDRKQAILALQRAPIHGRESVESNHAPAAGNHEQRQNDGDALGAEGSRF